MSAQKVSFTVRRPTPVSRASSGAESDSSFKIPSLPHHKLSRHLNDSSPGSPLARSANSSPRPVSGYYDGQPDSSDEEDEEQDELVTAFDRFGAQRVNKPKKVHQGPLVIPALKNKDWRELARKRRSANQYVPSSGQARTGADGSVGGMGTRDSINSGPVLSGLQMRNKVVKVEQGAVQEMEVQTEDVQMEETEDQKALRAILAGDTEGIDGPQIDIIPTPISEDDAYKQDIDELPDPATLADYNRVPVSQFGAAMLRGMGWKEGTAATRKGGKGMVEPYLPEARPALLGIGAKEQEVYDDGSGKRNGNKRPDRRYVPVVKMSKDENGEKRRERSVSPRRGYDSSRSSRRNSPDRYDDRWSSKPSRRDDDYDRESRRRDKERDRDYDRRDRRRDDRDRDRRRERS
ncbi:DExH-box splicing factor binding site-domain-containing protein [Desarmillaria tabescens]|uniref:DExH-box splicing factor binding site-domain-containing protein n=1 Tax=Armillaria tabescens TaxID=1929756 RepID=A0AA39N8T8_ARMTA|nr:DExH-box splicing factor binding site-domain-containing protein [Desarmillaria tabescens]KAK0461150.1 DExH-box splicing factor binding site-domain-containing protein [Desarmillaria tabescens]